MKRILSSIILGLALCTGAGAQVSIEEIIPMLSTNLVKASFSCTVGQTVGVNYSGTVIAQENCFAVKANGLESYCDGEKLVVVDPESHEIYIERATGLSDYLKDNIKELRDLKFSELRFLPKEKDPGFFKYPTDSLGSGWVITDLR